MGLQALGFRSFVGVLLYASGLYDCFLPLKIGLWGCLLWALGFYALEFRDYGVRILGLCGFAVAASRFNFNRILGTRSSAFVARRFGGQAKLQL